MKLLINTSNLYFGGGIQVALSFMAELNCLSNYDDQYHVAMSKALDMQLNQTEFSANFFFHLIESSPATLKHRKKTVNQLTLLEKKIRPDVVFTIFGPSYWKPKSKHLIGIADGWIYNPQTIAYTRLSTFKRIKRQLLGRYKTYYLKRDASFYVVETNDAKLKLVQHAGFSSDSIHVVGNTHSSAFNQMPYEGHTNYIKLPEREKDEYRLVYITHNHPNKNITIINSLLPLLKGVNITFVLTLGTNDYKSLFPSNPKQVLNIGTVAHQLCPSIYMQSDALFAPTLLETFSAAYPEAMKMGKPILTSNYSFATDICQQSALYFDPLDPKDIADKIIKLEKSKTLQMELIKRGKQQLSQFETASSRAEKYLQICNALLDPEFALTSRIQEDN